MSAARRSAEIRHWPAPCSVAGMWTRLARLFTVRTKFEAFLLIYALGLGAVERGLHYLSDYPGRAGWVMFAACTAAVFIAGGHILDTLDRRGG
jgi:hypothetical protein